MKKNIFTAAACVLALACAFTGCKKEEDSVTLKIRTAGMNTAAYQKSYINDKLPMLEVGDEILVNHEVTRSIEEESGKLTLKVPESSNGYTLVHRGICEAASGGAPFGGQAFIDSTQQYATTNDRQHLALPMAAYVAAGATDVEFKNAASVVKVVVTNLSGKAAHLHSVKAEAAVPLSGTLGFTLSTGNEISASTGETYIQYARNYVILECNEAITIPAGDSCGIYLVTAPFSKQKLTFTLNASLGNATAHKYVKYMNHEVDLALGNMGVYVFATDFGDPASTDPTPTDKNIPACTRKLFSVGEGKMVNFSPGNLQRLVKADNYYLRFAANQYDTGSLIPASNATKQVLVSYFGWGGQVHDHQPATGDTNRGDYGSLFPIYQYKSDGSYTTTDSKYDTNYWRTLSWNEWYYLLFDRTASTVSGIANARFLFCQVYKPTYSANYIGGLLIFPDAFILPADVTFNKKRPYYNQWDETSNISDYINTKQAFETIRITTENWKKLEKAGCVFLPAQGVRNSGNDPSNLSGCGIYILPTENNSSAYNSLYFGYNLIQESSINKAYMSCVRLVHNAYGF